jgi:Holliday junction resolvase RusA-like endonuclease
VARDTVPSTLPLAWQTIVAQEDVVAHFKVLERPKVQSRGRASASLAGWVPDSMTAGQIRKTKGAIITHVFTPATTRTATEVMQWRMKARRYIPAPVTGEVGLFIWFQLPGQVMGDTSNLLKLVEDAGNQVLWEDDRQIAEFHVHRSYDSPEPGTDILCWRRR